MKKNRLIAVVLALATFLTSGMTVLADRVDAKLDKPFISLGADLNAEEKARVLNILGVKEEDLGQYDVLTAMSMSIWMNIWMPA